MASLRASLPLSLIVLLAACGGGASAPTDPGPVSDGNGTFATAQAVALGSTTAGTISSPTDDDWYVFTTPGAGTITVTLGALTADADLALVDSGQALLTGSNNAGTTTDVLTWTAAGADSFRVHVIPVTAPANYELSVAFVAAPPPPPPPPPTDGNDTFATAQAVAIPSSTAGVISSTTDDDWYHFTTGAPGQVLVMLSGLSADADLALVDAGQAVLGTSGNAGTAVEVVSHAAGAAGTFYAHVIPKQAGATYTFRTGFVPAGIVDGNDTFGTAQSMPIGSTIAGAISSNTDEDWYTFTTPGAGTVTVTLDGLFGDADLQLYGQLSYQLIAFSYFAGTTPDVASYTATGPVAYHVRVLPRGAITPYTLTATFTP